jgi:hypothetical protein
MERFNYATPGELYFPKLSAVQRPYGIMYRRFGTAAEALRFAIENIPSPFLQNCYMEVEGERFEARQMQQLYESVEYPLPRHGDKA